MPRLSISTLLWLTAIVAIAAALPRSYLERVDADGHVKRYDYPIADEIAWRGMVVIFLVLVVLAGYWLFRAKRSPPPLVWALWFGTLLASVATAFWLLLGDLDP
jgi:hypothetical protein